MFCPKCGNQLTEGAQFCSQCGARQLPPAHANSYQQSDNPPPCPYPQGPSPYAQRPVSQDPVSPHLPPHTPEPRKKKAAKKTPIWISLLIIIAAYFLGRFVIAPLLFDNDNKPDNSIAIEDTASSVDEETLSAEESEDPSEPSAEEAISEEPVEEEPIEEEAVEEEPIEEEPIEEEPVEEEPAEEEPVEEEATDTSSAASNSEYTAVFSSTGLFDGLIPSSEVIMWNYNSYVAVDAEGNIDRMELGYENDQVYVMVETIYFPLTDIPEESYNELDVQMQEAYAFIEEYPFCSVTYQLPNNTTTTPYYQIKIVYNQLDSMDNVQILADIGILDTADATFISASASETGLLQSGYIKR